MQHAWFCCVHSFRFRKKPEVAMKFLLIAFVTFLLVAEMAFAAGPARQAAHVDNMEMGCLRHLDVEYYGDRLMLVSRSDADLLVEITRQNELYINGKNIPLTDEERIVVASYYNSYEELIDNACRMARNGIELGASGVHAGLKALSGAFSVFVEDMDEVQFEVVMEDEAERLEEVAEALEENAHDLEILAADIEVLHEELKEEIPELDQLEWF